MDPDGIWKDRLQVLCKEDIRGPGKDPNEQVTNGRFEPSWIWLGKVSTPGQDEFNETMQMEWVKSRARMMRWQEEVEIVQEEMRRVLAWCNRSFSAFR